MKYNNVLIVGYGESGKAVETILLDKKINYVIYDDRLMTNTINKIKIKDLKKFDLVVVSPAINKSHKIIKYCNKRKIKVISELEFGFENLSKKTKIIGITGTNGKTTTTTLINNCLKNAGFKSEALGNIGKPLSFAYKKDYDYVVCETSTFQLENIIKFKCEYSAIINIGEDHLERHKNLKNYIDLKFKIIKNSESFDYVILNCDDKNIMFNMPDIKSNFYFISKNQTCKGCYIDKNGIIVLNISEKIEKLFSVNIIKLPAIFYEDVLICILICKLLNIENNIIEKSISSISNLSHKYEILTTISNKMIINDSKATNIHAVVESVKNTKKEIILLLGGYDKGLNFNNFFKSYSFKIKYIVAFGMMKNTILKYAKRNNYKNIVGFESLKEAVEYGYGITDMESALLFSPGCSSFDEFANYKERGDFFKNLIEQFERNNGKIKNK